MIKVKLEHKLVIKARKAVDEILDTTGEMTRTIKLTQEQEGRIGEIDELAFRIRANLAKLSNPEAKSIYSKGREEE